jgi:hypothetical protein
MHREFVLVAAGHQRRNGEEAAGAPVEHEPGPDLAPRVAGDEVLEVGGFGVIAAVTLST